MSELIMLRVIHVVGGMFWVGTVVFNSLFLIPALAASGPAAATVMGHLQRRRLFVVLPIVALLTLLAGVRILQIASGGFSAAYFASATGRTYAIGAALAILAFLIGVSIVRPAMDRVGRLGASIATAQDDAARSAISAEMGALRRRGASANAVVAALLVVSAISMAVGRYM